MSDSLPATHDPRRYEYLLGLGLPGFESTLNKLHRTAEGKPGTKLARMWLLYLQKYGLLAAAMRPPDDGGARVLESHTASVRTWVEREVFSQLRKSVSLYACGKLTDAEIDEAAEILASIEDEAVSRHVELLLEFPSELCRQLTSPNAS